MQIVNVLGADNKATNQSEGDYVAKVQVATARCKLYKITVSVPTATGADVIVWLFDTAAGTDNSTGPDAIFTVPYGQTATLDFPDGSIFHAGLYVVAASNAPTDADEDTPTPIAANKALIKVDYRVL